MLLSLLPSRKNEKANEIIKHNVFFFIQRYLDSDMYFVATLSHTFAFLPHSCESSCSLVSQTSYPQTRSVLMSCQITVLSRYCWRIHFTVSIDELANPFILLRFSLFCELAREGRRVRRIFSSLAKDQMRINSSRSLPKWIANKHTQSHVHTYALTSVLYA